MADDLVLNCRRFILEILVLIICLVVDLVIRLGDVLPIFRRGFFCNDESIRYPFNGETVSELEMKIYAFGIGIVVILITELIVNWKSEEDDDGVRGYFLCTEAPVWINFAYKYLLGFLVAMILNEVLKQIISALIGRLRPCFISACEPDLDLSNCTEFGTTYITNYTCKAGNVDFYRQSFYSGHTAIPACAAAFVVVYIHARWKQKGAGRILTAFASFLVILGALMIAASRISDNLHFPSDVLTGIIVGALVGVFFARYVCGLECKQISQTRVTNEFREEDAEKQPLCRTIGTTTYESARN